MTGYIYTLSEPSTGLVRYVGQTINVAKRYGLHLYHSQNGRATTHKEKWINTLTNSGVKPEMEIVWECDASHLDQKETEFIALFKSFGAHLTNATLGGTTTRGRKCSEETKRKLSETMKGKCLRPPITEAEKQALSIRQRGFKMPESAKQKLSNDRKGKPSYWSFNEMPQDVKDKWHAAAKQLSKPVIAIKDGSEVHYPSRKEAARQTGCQASDVLRVLAGKRSHTKGYAFKYANL